MSDAEPTARERILAAALEEFATRGYEAASTNAIAAKAKVAKGLVFHHFGSKEQLLEVLFEREVNRLIELVFAMEGPMSPDLFERLHQLSMRKIELTRQHPLTSDFILVAITEAPPALKVKLAQRQAQFMKTTWPRVLEGLDASRLAPGVTLMDAVETLTMMSEGLEKQLSALMKARQLSMVEIAAHAWKHFERLRDGLYRKG
ncbi:MAG: TetR/AcrR family transcriptional regulator [Myxococcales bacterium]|nr:TetR/AcrR family transcriptional regulator [Myxococcales bacterium]